MIPTWLTLDLETRSVLDVTDVGVFKYAEHPSTGIWCMSYAFDDGPVQRWQPGEPVPKDIRYHVETGRFLRAWNAQFEATMWGHLVRDHGFPVVRPKQWVCSAALGARCGLPRNLEDAAKVMALPFQKDIEGHKLMKQMCVPVGMHINQTTGEVEYTWEQSKAKLARLMAYCDQDVETERGVFNALPDVGHPMERALWLLDQEVNRRGIQLDLSLIHGMQAIGGAGQDIIDRKLCTITEGAVERATQVARILSFAEKQGVTLTGLDKALLRDTLKTELPDIVRQVLILRQKGSKSSLGKLETMLDVVCRDGRARGVLLYFGAGPGRWAGKLIQTQNFPRPTVEVEESDIEWLRAGELVDPPAGKPVMSLLASALRGCIIAAPGNELVVADFEQIEARVLAWVANCTDLLDLFRRGESPYLHMGKVIYGRPITKKGDPFEYQVSKNTVLGCGYQMGPLRYQEQAKEQTGLDLPDELCQRAVTAYRETYWQIPVLWKALNTTAKIAVSTGTQEWLTMDPFEHVGVAFRMDGGWLRMRLPSGRSIFYARPRIRPRKTPWGEIVPAVVVEGVDSKTKQWRRKALYGGLLTENAVQAIARDIMGCAMLRLDATYPVVLTCHDEVISEVPAGSGNVEEFVNLMTQPPEWAAGCPISAEGWRGTRYRK